MKINILSSWGVACGVASVTSTLVSNLGKLGVSCKIIAPKREPYVPVNIGLGYVVYYDNEADAIEMMEETDGPVYIQYNNALFSASMVLKILRNARVTEQKTIVTLHDSCIGSSDIIREADVITSASRRLLRSTYTIAPGNNQRVHIPFGVPQVDAITDPLKRVVSFGLGRNRDDLIQPIAKKYQYDFTTFYGHHKWTPKDQLLKELSNSKLVSLYYPDTGAVVSSSALPLAIGSKRPVICSKTTWFQPEDLIPMDHPNESTWTRYSEFLIDFCDDDSLDRVMKQILDRKVNHARNNMIDSMIKDGMGEDSMALKFKELLNA